MIHYNKLFNRKNTILLIFLFFIFGCSNNIEIYENGKTVESINWDKTYLISLEIPRNSVCWIETETEELDYFSGAILNDGNTTHITKGEFISSLDYLNFDITLKKDFALNTPDNASITININCNNDELKFKKTYDIN